MNYPYGVDTCLPWGWTLSAPWGHVRPYHCMLKNLSNKGSKYLSITSLFFKGEISFWAMPSTLRFLRNYYHKHLPVNIWFFWIIWGNFSPPHKDRTILRVLSISKEILALTNTWFFAFSIHSMKFCLLQFSPFFACHFIKKLKRIKKGEKSCSFFNEGCGFLFTKRKIKVVIFLSYDHWIWDQKLCISEGRGGKHSGIFYIVFISILHF